MYYDTATDRPKSQSGSHKLTMRTWSSTSVNGEPVISYSIMKEFKSRTSLRVSRKISRKKIIRSAMAVYRLSRYTTVVPVNFRPHIREASAGNICIQSNHSSADRKCLQGPDERAQVWRCNTEAHLSWPARSNFAQTWRKIRQ